MRDLESKTQKPSTFEVKFLCKTLKLSPRSQTLIKEIEDKLGDYIPRSKDSSKTFYTAIQGSRCCKELNNLALLGLFSVSQTGQERKYEVSPLYTEIWKTYLRLKDI